MRDSTGPGMTVTPTGTPAMVRGCRKTGTGTSTAFPHASGLAALLLTVNPAFSHAEVQAIMQWSAKNLLDDEEDYEVDGKRDLHTGWGLLDGTAAVQMAIKRRFAVTGQDGKHLFSIDRDGNFAINGNVKPNATTLELTPDNNVREFIVRKTSSGTILARMDPTWGIDPAHPCETLWPTLYLKGCLVRNQTTLTPPSDNPSSFIIKNDDGQDGTVVAYISSQDGDYPAGSLVLKGSVFIGADPDPQARRTRLVFYDTFEDEDYAAPVTAWGREFYDQGNSPEWVPADENDWEVAQDGDSYVLRNKGSYAHQHNEHADDIQIDQPKLDNDVNIDFKYTAASPVQVSVRSATERVYVLLDPAQPSQNVQVVSTLDAFESETAQYSFVEGAWYEMHVRSIGDKVHVWLRPLDPQQPAPWSKVLEVSDDDLAVTQCDHFGIKVVHDDEQDGRWRFDNVTVNASLAGIDPETDPGVFDCPNAP